MFAPRTIAFFDFDHTLICGDSLRRFFLIMGGAARCRLALAQVTAHYARLKFGRRPVDRSLYFKTEMLKRVVAGRDQAAIEAAAEQVRRDLRWIAPIREKLFDHAEAGHKIVIASGSLNLYLPRLLRDLPPHDLICTEIEMREGKATSNLVGVNCIREGKAAKVKEYLAAQPPYDESYGYGNYPDDLPMLKLMKHQTIV